MDVAFSRVQQTRQRVNERMGTIAGKTGMSGFAAMFTEAASAAQQQTTTTTNTASVEAAVTADGLLDTATATMTVYGKYPLVTKTTGSSLSEQVSGRAEQYADIIEAASKKYDLSESLIRAVIYAESSFNQNSVSGAGAIGLMQLMPGTAEGLGVDPYDPAENIDGGVRYILSCLERFDGDLKMAMAAYNCGPYGLVKRGVTSLDTDEDFAKLPSETRTYLRNIANYLSDEGAISVMAENKWTRLT